MQKFDALKHRNEAVRSDLLREYFLRRSTSHCEPLGDFQGGYSGCAIEILVVGHRSS